MCVATFGLERYYHIVVTFKDLVCTTVFSSSSFLPLVLSDVVVKFAFSRPNSVSTIVCHL